MLEINALIRILKRNGITDEDEVLKEVEKLKVEMDEQIKKMRKENKNEINTKINLYILDILNNDLFTGKDSCWKWNN